MITASVHSLIGSTKPQKKVASRLRLRRCLSASNVASSTNTADVSSEYADAYSSEDEGIPITREVRVQFEVESAQEFVPASECVPILLRMRMWMFQYKRAKERQKRQEQLSSQRSGDHLPFASSTAGQSEEKQLRGVVHLAEVVQSQTSSAQSTGGPSQASHRHVVEETPPSLPPHPLGAKPQGSHQVWCPPAAPTVRWSEPAQCPGGDGVYRPTSSQQDSSQPAVLSRTTPHSGEDDSSSPDLKERKLQQHVPQLYQSGVGVSLAPRPPHVASQKAAANARRLQEKLTPSQHHHHHHHQHQALHDLAANQVHTPVEVQGGQPQTTTTTTATTTAGGGGREVETTVERQQQSQSPSPPQLQHTATRRFSHDSVQEAAAVKQQPQTTAAGPVVVEEQSSGPQPQHTHPHRGREDSFWCGIDGNNPSPVRTKPPLSRKTIKKKKTKTAAKPRQPQEGLAAEVVQNSDYHREWRLSAHPSGNDYEGEKVLHNQPTSDVNSSSNLNVADSDMRRGTHSRSETRSANQQPTRVRSAHRHRNDAQALGPRLSEPVIPLTMQEDKGHGEQQRTSKTAQTKKERTRERPIGGEGRAKSTPSLPSSSTGDHSVEGRTGMSSSNPWTLSGPPLYVPPRANSNKKLIRNAVGTVCLAGTANSDRRHEVIQELDKKGGNHLLILFKDSAGSIKFKALYNYHPEEDEARRIYGTGPRTVTSAMAAKFYKYNSGKRDFEEVVTKTLSIRMSGFTLKSSFQKK